MSLDLVTVAPPDYDFEPPNYSIPGRVLFRWYRDPEFFRSGWGIEIYDWDRDTSLFWMNEGVGISYQLEQMLDLDQEGWYVAQEITGSISTYWGPDGRDDSEEWCIEGLIRYATEDEIKTEQLVA